MDGLAGDGDASRRLDAGGADGLQEAPRFTVVMLAIVGRVASSLQLKVFGPKRLRRKRGNGWRKGGDG
eukprot:5218923-Pyramimonas_sp.AAC.2